MSEPKLLTREEIIRRLRAIRVGVSSSPLLQLALKPRHWIVLATSCRAVDLLGPVLGSRCRFVELAVVETFSPLPLPLLRKGLLDGLPRFLSFDQLFHVGHTLALAVHREFVICDQHWWWCRVGFGFDRFGLQAVPLSSFRFAKPSSLKPW